MITTSDFKKGLRFLLDGQPCTILEHTTHSPSARGAATLVRIRARNVLTGQMVERTFKAGEKFEQPDLEFRTCKLLYRDGDDLHFMDQGSYEQFSMTVEALAESVVWLTEELELRAVVFNGTVAGIELPSFVEMEVSYTEAASPRDTATGKNLKGATLANGENVRVPIYIQAGERVRIDTRTGEFVDRVSG